MYRILVIEDDEKLREQIVEMLKANEYEAKPPRLKDFTCKFLEVFRENHYFYMISSSINYV